MKILSIALNKIFGIMITIQHISWVRHVENDFWSEEYRQMRRRTQPHHLLSAESCSYPWGKKRVCKTYMAQVKLVQDKLEGVYQLFNLLVLSWILNRCFAVVFAWSTFTHSCYCAWCFCTQCSHRLFWTFRQGKSNCLYTSIVKVPTKSYNENLFKVYSWLSQYLL